MTLKDLYWVMNHKTKVKVYISEPRGVLGNITLPTSIDLKSIGIEDEYPTLDQWCTCWNLTDKYVIYHMYFVGRTNITPEFLQVYLVQK